MTDVLGRDVFFQYLEHHGIPYMFGNPGTTEVTFVDGCNDHPSVQYVLSLHEDVAVAQAIGYARASGKVGVINLHVTPGVAHALGNLYNAYHARVPLLVTAGQHHSAFKIQEPILTSDLVALMRPFTKWSFEVTQLEELPMALQRAFKELTTPPYAPVFLSIASNLFLERYEDPPHVGVSHIPATIATPEAIDCAAAVLAAATNPIIIAGDEAGRSGAWVPLVSIAESLGARVFTEGYATMWNFPATHPLYSGPMPNLATAMRDIFDDVDVALMCGVTCQAPVARYDGGGPLVPWRVRVVSVDDSAREIGKNQPVAVGITGDIAKNLAALAIALPRQRIDATAAGARTDAMRDVFIRRVEQRASDVQASRGADHITATLVAAELRERLSPDAIYVDEAISNRPAFVGGLEFNSPVEFFSANGISLGYSVGVAVGMQLAQPDRQIVNVVGDGSLMYNPQALWSAANLRTPVLFVVLNNGCYRVLKVIINRMGGPWAANGHATPGLDFNQPQIDFVKLASSMGIEASRAETPHELREALDEALRERRPYLVEVVVPSD